MHSTESDALDQWLSHARVLLVDNEPANLTFLRHVLETEGYGELIAMTDAAEAVERLRELDPDVIVVDLWMRHLDGFEFIARVQDLVPAGTYLPILVATGDPSPEARRRALSLGARDFLTKPLSPSEVRLRVRSLMETRFLHERLRRHNLRLEQRVDERTLELEEARLEILYRLARAAEFRDDLTSQHTLRVGRLSGRIAQVLGLGAEQAELIGRAAPLHDIGKIGVPDAVLLKRARLDEQERAVIEKHTIIGAEILSGSGYPLLQLAEEIALSHHERWDGLGYPRALAGDAIPVAGRIVAVADVFDALTHERPYKEAWTVRQALAEIEAQAGTQFDPAVVEALLRVAPETRAMEIEINASAEARRTAPGAGPTEARTDVVIPAAAVSMMAMQRLQEERDTLAREVERLSRRLARRGTRRKAQRRSAPPAAQTN
jgi:putative two-component system response regulator